jgi:Hemerythrin HHE cation binding domain
MDITDLILEDHRQQRRSFAFLEDIDPSDTETLGALWNRLCTTLEVHAAAEEALFYPELLKIGRGEGGESVDDEVEDVIKDHNAIRDAIRGSTGHEAGSKQWWEAVRKTNEANSDHMAEEERDDLADFRRHATLQMRHDIGVAFARFEAQHVAGIEPKDLDPKRYVAENRQP